MYAKSGGVFLLLTLFIISCKTEWKTEKEESEFWASSVIDPSYKVLYSTEDIKQSLRFFDSLQKHTGKSTPYIQAARYRVLANYHWFLTKNNDSTGIYIDSGLAVYHKPAFQRKYPRSYVGLLLFGGEVAFRLGNYAKSNEYFFLAKQSADQYLDPCARSEFTYNVAMVSYRQQNYAEAATYFKEAFAAQATCPIQTTAIILQQQEIQSNIGLCLVKLNKYDSALIHFNKSLQISKQFKDSLGTVTLDRIKGVVLGNIAKIYVAKKNYKKAEALFTESMTLNGKPGYEINDALLVQLQLAEVYQLQSKTSQMKTVLQAARLGLDTLGNKEGEINWSRLMAAYYKEANQPVEEFHYFKRFVVLRDSMEATNKHLIQADISRQLKDKEQAVRIAVLTKDNMLNQIFLWIVVIFSIMALIIILLIYFYYKRSKENVATLTKLNSEITEQKAALELANQEKDRILQVVAHDLRNPIGIAVYIADLALMEDLDEKTENSLQMIKTASKQALNLTNELLGVRSNETDDYQKESIDLVSFVKNIVQLLYYKAEEKGQHITVYSSEEFLFINGDSQKLNRLLSNLIINAIKFSPLEQVITIKIGKEGKQALIAIQDNGVGIGISERETIFDRFTKARKRGTSGEKSFGLGLSICREIVEVHKGTIQLESEEGKGTTFYVRFPLTDNV